MMNGEPRERQRDDREMREQPERVPGVEHPGLPGRDKARLTDPDSAIRRACQGLRDRIRTGWRKPQRLAVGPAWQGHQLETSLRRAKRHKTPCRLDQIRV
jgi:hypothetical protein